MKKATIILICLWILKSIFSEICSMGLDMFVWYYLRPIWGLIILIVPQVLVYLLLRWLFGKDGGNALFIVWIIGFIIWATL